MAEAKHTPEHELVYLKGWDNLLGALDRADRKGYLPDAIEDKWDALEISDVPAVYKAAPDLLAALIVAVTQNEHDMLMTGEECRAARAAIARAKVAA